MVGAPSSPTTSQFPRPDTAKYWCGSAHPPSAAATSAPSTENTSDPVRKATTASSPGTNPSGQVIAIGPGTKRIVEGDRVAIYHITGCGQCSECVKGYFISCTSPARSAYGWQRDGGHADYLLAEEVSCVRLPDSLTYVDGACVACGFSTAYEALVRLQLSGQDSLLITGLGPVGLAAGLLAKKLGAAPVYGTDPASERAQLAMDLGAVDDILSPDDISGAKAGTIAAAVDCSGSAPGRRTALTSLARWGRLAFVGEGGDISFDVSHEVIHRQITLIGSWVTSVGRMTELLERLDVWKLHPEIVVSDRFDLDHAGSGLRTRRCRQIRESGAHPELIRITLFRGEPRRPPRGRVPPRRRIPCSR